MRSSSYLIRLSTLGAFVLLGCLEYAVLAIPIDTINFVNATSKLLVGNFGYEKYITFSELILPRRNCVTSLVILWRIARLDIYKKICINREEY